MDNSAVKPSTLILPAKKIQKELQIIKKFY